MLHRRHLAPVASLREKVVADIADQPPTLANAAEIGSARMQMEAREQALAGLGGGGGLMVDAEPQRLGVELVNCYHAAKRSGALRPGRLSAPTARARRANRPQRSSSSRLPGLPSHSLPSAGPGFFSVITGQFLASSALSLSEVLLVLRHFILGEDGLGRALRLAQRAVDALIRIDHQEVRALVEAVHRADFHAVHVLALDAVFANDEGHAGSRGGQARDCRQRRGFQPGSRRPSVVRWDALGAGRAIRQVLLQGVADGGEGQLAPGDVRLVHQLRFQAFLARAIPRRWTCGRGNRHAPARSLGAFISASGEPMSTCAMRLLEAFAGRAVLQRLAQFHEAGRQGPVAAARLDGAAADEDLPWCSGTQPTTTSGLS